MNCTQNFVLFAECVPFTQYLYASALIPAQVTTDIYDDVERQNLLLDDTSNSFSSFANSLTQSGRHFTRAFGGTKTWRIGLYTVGALVGLWLSWKIFRMFWYA